ncbi:MAG: iron(III) transport system substrate-binding protein [Alphaproteobacteria bacterium]|jgi:iron(III) transport system substrate-binding protein
MSTGNTTKFMFAAALTLGTLGTGIETAKATDSVNVYSSRHYDSDKIIYREFEKATGIKVNVVAGNVATLFERLKREGRNSPADVLITVDAGNLGRAQAANLFQPMKSALIEKVVPAHLREQKGLWTGLSMRARVIMYHKDRVTPAQLSTYEDLSDSKWKGKILIRSSNNIYNQSLVGSMIATHGKDGTLTWAKGLVANMARKPKGGDRDQIRAVGAGEGDIAISNTYYLGGLAASKQSKDKALVAKIGVFFPNQNGRGTHVNISGAGITRYAKNKKSAVQLIEYMLSRKSQKIFGDLNYEYPIREDVEAHPIIDSWGKFKKDALSVSVIGANNADAVRLMDKAGWR